MPDALGTKMAADEKPKAETFGALETDPNGKTPNEPGAKLDAGKNRIGLVLFGFARALQEVGKVGTYGANKYTDNGWTEVPDGERRYTDALLRHLRARRRARSTTRTPGFAMRLMRRGTRWRGLIWRCATTMPKRHRSTACTTPMPDAPLSTGRSVGRLLAKLAPKSQGFTVGGTGGDYMPLASQLAAAIASAQPHGAQLIAWVKYAQDASASQALLRELLLESARWEQSASLAKRQQLRIVIAAAFAEWLAPKACVDCGGRGATFVRGDDGAQFLELCR